MLFWIKIYIWNHICFWSDVYTTSDQYEHDFSTNQLIYVAAGFRDVTHRSPLRDSV